MNATRLSGKKGGAWGSMARGRAAAAPTPPLVAAWRRARAAAARRPVGALLLSLALALALALGPAPALAQEFTLRLGDDTELTARLVQIFLLITVLSLAPASRSW